MIQLIIILFALVIAVTSVDNKIKPFENGAHHIIRSTNLDWWETAVFYQIYPRSFKDSDGDGIGDLNGIIEKLDHLKDAGVTAAWLSPIFKSPQIDQGYDISDYYDIDEDYGTLDDFKNLLAKAKALGIKIILDFVPNHTSDKHVWFQKSVEGDEEYKDYYVWHDGKDVDGVKEVPNNWISNFKGSAWEYNDIRGQYYYHEFAVQQPDLNYSNPAVVTAMKNVLTYWLDIGVDGFRVDAVPFLFEDPEFRDEPLASGYTEYDINDWNCLDHTYTKDLQNTFNLIYEFRKHLDTYTTSLGGETRVMMTEAYSPIEKQMLYYGTSDGSTKGAHFTFNFEMISSISSKFTVDDITNSINKWLAYLPNQYTSNWVLGNHDNHRVATRYGKENVDGFNMLIAILPGVMVTYNGEEIGMEDGEVSCKQGHDPQAIKNCSSFAETSRDFERTPFQWDNSAYAGFSNVTPWLPVSSKAQDVNLAAQNVAGISSHCNIYKNLLLLRKNFQNGSEFDAVSVVKLSDTVLQIIRHVDDEEYSLLFNIGNDEASVDFVRGKDTYVAVVVSLNSSYTSGGTVDNKLSLQGHESLILKGMTKNGQTRLHADKVIPCVITLVLYKIIVLY